MNATLQNGAQVQANPRPKPLVVDTRPIFAARQKPNAAVERAVKRLQPGQTLTLIFPYEPVVWYAKLGREGFCHHAEHRMDGMWQVEFHRFEGPGENPKVYGSCTGAAMGVPKQRGRIISVHEPLLDWNV